MASRPYNIAAICAGVGGLELGVRIARPDACGVVYLEREIAAAARLAARMQDGSLHPAPIWSDLTTFDPEPWRGLVDCVTSGDPCQPNSVAGKRRGQDDDRWLLDHIFRIVEGVRPSRFFRENVPGNADGQLAAIVPALERLGGRVAAGIFSARSAGASHIRERLFIMADFGSVANHEGERPGKVGGFQFDGSAPRIAGVGDGVDDSQSRRREGRDSSRPRTSSIDASNKSMVIPTSKRRRKGVSESEFRSGGNSPSGSSNSLGNPIGGGHGRLEIEPRWGAGRGTSLDWPSGRPLFAPAPNDPVWQEIIGSSPLDAPAISDADVAQACIIYETAGVGFPRDQAQAQSIVRRLDAWLAQRVDRLRQGGNGVSSLAAAVAWSTLDALLSTAT